MAKNSSDINEIFTSIAHRYDLLNTILTLNIDELWRRRAIYLSGIKPGKRVLDLCCGTGKMVELECGVAGRTTEVIGLDFNQEMLRVGSRRLRKKRKGYCYRLIQGDAMALPFEDSSFDCVTIAFGLRNLPDKRKAINEMYRVLKPGGKMVCLELSKPEMPVFSFVYDFYFNYLLPIIGYLGTGDKKAYDYLRDSVNGFMKKKELLKLIKGTGFHRAGYQSLSMGIASIHYGIKAKETRMKCGWE